MNCSIKLSSCFAFPSPLLLYPPTGVTDELGAGGMDRELADGVAVLAGEGARWLPSPAEDYLETPLDLTEYLIENKAATFMMRVDGDSMKDAGILDGDLPVMDRTAKPVNGSVVVVAVNGEYRGKRLLADLIELAL